MKFIYQHSETLEHLDEEIEVDESYFGSARKGNRGRGTADKVPVFGLLKRNGKVYAVMIPESKTITLMYIIRQKVNPIVLFTQTIGEPITHLMYRNLNITE